MLKDAPTVAVIGGGHMARALIGGWLANGLPPARLRVADPFADARAAVERDFPGVRAFERNEDACAGAGVWIFAVKPQMLGDVARGLAALAANAPPLAISVAAGIRGADLQRWLGPRVPVVRTMPNRPALLGAGATALYAGPGVDASQRALAARLLDAVGTTVWVDDESAMDAVTAVSGSGPAYFFLLIELLEAAARAEGLSDEVARRLAIETAYGAARMARESTDDPATLRAQVTSKGGTTAAALAVMEAAGLRDIVRRAVGAASARSRELAAEFGNEERGRTPGGRD
jgi:pyrroline-5-carboxylate reductase